MSRAEVSHPAVVVSDLLCWQPCPLAPALTDALDHRAEEQQPSPPDGRREHGLELRSWHTSGGGKSS